MIEERRDFILSSESMDSFVRFAVQGIHNMRLQHHISKASVSIE